MSELFRLHKSPYFLFVLLQFKCLFTLLCSILSPCGSSFCPFYRSIRLITTIQRGFHCFLSQCFSFPCFLFSLINSGNLSFKPSNLSFKPANSGFNSRNPCFELADSVYQRVYLLFYILLCGTSKRQQ